MLRCVCCKVDKILCQIVVSEMVNIHVDKLGQFRVHGHSDMQHKQPGRCEFGSFLKPKETSFCKSPKTQSSSEVAINGHLSSPGTKTRL